MSVVFFRGLFTSPLVRSEDDKSCEALFTFSSKKQAFSYVKRKMEALKVYENLYGFQLRRNFTSAAKRYYIGNVLTDEQVSELKRDFIRDLSDMPDVVEDQRRLIPLKQKDKKNSEVIVKLRSPITSGDSPVENDRYVLLHSVRDVFVLDENLKQIWPKPAARLNLKMPFLGNLLQKQR